MYSPNLNPSISRTIVPAPNEPQNYYNNPLAGEASSSKSKQNLKDENKELVSTAMDGDHRQCRETVRRTRLILNSIPKSGLPEEENNRKVMKVLKALMNKLKEVNNSRIRNDLTAATSMNDHRLCLYHDKKIIGPVPGVCIGDVFLYRTEMCVIGLHGQPQAGIDYSHPSMSTNGKPVATSVIVPCGSDDVDQDDFVINSGQGDKKDQKLQGGNLAMVTNMQYEIDVRVIRGVEYDGVPATTSKVFVYDGLYKITKYWWENGESGFRVYKFLLSRVKGQPKIGSMILEEARMLKIGQLCSNSMYVISHDISNGKENIGVSLYNDIDNDQYPMQFEYLPKAAFPQFVLPQSMTTRESRRAKECSESVDGCISSIKNGNTFPYSKSGILLKGRSLIYECGPFCSCPLYCRNRVTQKGLEHRLEVFRSNETSWGVRSLDLILAGEFICEFTGLVLTRQQVEILTMDGEHNSLMIDPSRFFNSRTQEWGDLSRIDANHVPPSYPPLDFALDISMMRNVASYISHSPTPNVFVQLVLFDHDNWRFPHLMVFAMENILPMGELSLDHGKDAGLDEKLTGKLAICN
ncbi:histone-lysine N-methyltransferase family member SUVH9 [Medicago truncatula]|uniref:Histone-lysine N-methyltransferase, suvh protein, putative n=2 Tax=Medicago truncatula TaxID=3880 RepID=A0A072TR32_MEDTR|nr:histone-lysine N-methyltransferase family member SUVH9 [Medicago truncatula]KEH16020.1 histone-lysine N-methyltransferase, suvh protein, putative [Medicago truncatula]